MTSQQAKYEQPVRIPAGRFELDGTMSIPAGAAGVTLFAHGSGSSRLSPRNVFVAQELQRAGVGTLLFDLLTDPEARDRDLVFDIDLLAERLKQAVHWVAQAPESAGLAIGLFGASTGAAAALQVAAQEVDAVKAVVSRGGRPDLAAEYLEIVQAPTLLIVGGRDFDVIELNQDAYGTLNCPKEMVIVPGATHLFEEPGALEEVAEHAARWFRTHLSPPRVIRA
jgi:pimeloyl-ACP methyl ester carboxylesterase